MKGDAKEVKICGATIRLGDWVKVEYKTGLKMKGGTIEGKVVELWSPELSNGHLQARVESGWCFHDSDRIIAHKPLDPRTNLKPYYSDDFVTIFHGDCRALLPSLTAEPDTLVVTDPPFNIGYHYATHKDKMDIHEYQSMLGATCLSPCVVIHYSEDLCALSWTLEEIPKKIVAWVYPSNTGRQWRGIAWFGCEPDFTKEGQDYKNPTDKRIAERIARGERARLYDWWEINQVKNVSSEKTEHPCQMPLEVMRRILKITPCKLVIDTFCGSGTTLLAAKQLGIKSIGIDLDESYCEIAAKRMSVQFLPL